MAIEVVADAVAVASLGLFRTDPDYPAEEDVESGVEYGNGDYTGTLEGGSGVNSTVRVEGTNQR